MADIKPFQCIRPEKELAKHVASLPYDVYNRSEACEKSKAGSSCFLILTDLRHSLTIL